MVTRKRSNTPANQAALLHYVRRGIITIPELAGILDISRQTAWRYAKAAGISPAAAKASRLQFIGYLSWRATYGKKRTRAEMRNDALDAFDDATATPEIIKTIPQGKRSHIPPGQTRRK